MSINRRTVVRSTAWTVPAVAVASAAPAFATTGRLLSWTFTVEPVPLADSKSTACDDLKITFDNTASGPDGVDLVPTKVRSEVNIFGQWHGQDQANAEAIAAGTSYSMQVGQSIPAGYPLRFAVSFNDASGTTVTRTTGEVTTGACGKSATFSHISQS